MDMMDLLKMGASLIQNNSDDATTGIDTDTITNALGSLFGGNSEGEGGLDLSSLVSNLTDGDLGQTVASWIGDGENLPIDKDKITDLLGSDKVSEFAENLGIDIESAKGALADALPNVVDQATNEDSDLMGSLLEKVGGIDGALDLAKKFFG